MPLVVQRIEPPLLLLVLLLLVVLLPLDVCVWLPLETDAARRRIRSDPLRHHGRRRQQPHRQSQWSQRVRCFFLGNWGSGTGE